MRACFRTLTLVGCYFVTLISTPHCWAIPPKVIKAIPDNGDTNVDPMLREIRISFDQAMFAGGQSVVGGGESFPELLGKQPGKWRGSRTFVLGVRLKPDFNRRGMPNSVGRPRWAG